MEVSMKRIGIPLLVFLACLIAAPITAWAGSHIVYVPPPNGVDDTANIQAALDACVAYDKNCTVQLAAGTYHTRQLVEYNFQGTFKGMGTSNTTIQAIYPLPVNLPDFYYYGVCMPDTNSCLYPSLIIFVNGNIEVSDLRNL
jgi:pectin methylesterase-like acyl-CoA thioesterase